jgi:hypothetical protein
VLGEHFRAYFDVPADAITREGKDSTKPLEFSWHLDDDDEGGSHITTLSTPTIRVKSPSSASLSVKSVKEPAVLSDHHYAESSPNLQRQSLTRPSSFAASTVDAHDSVKEESGAHTRVVFLVSAQAFSLSGFLADACRPNKSAIILQSPVFGSSAQKMVYKDVVLIK